MAKKKSKKKPVTHSHKSPEAAKARDALEQKLITKLGHEGLTKHELAAAVGSDATATKAALDRLKRKGLARTEGTTMKTTYVRA